MRVKSYSFMFIFVFCFVFFLFTDLQAKLVKHYDSDADLTIINTEPSQVMELNPWKQPRLSIVIQYPGQIPPPFLTGKLIVKMSFISLSKKQKFDNCTEIQCSADRKLVFQRKFELDTNVMKESVMETMTVNVPYVEFGRMIDADHLEFEICAIKLELHRIERKDIMQVREMI